MIVIDDWWDAVSPTSYYHAYGGSLTVHQFDVTRDKIDLSDVYPRSHLSFSQGSVWVQEDDSAKCIYVDVDGYGNGSNNVAWADMKITLIDVQDDLSASNFIF